MSARRSTERTQAAKAAMCDAASCQMAGRCMHRGHCPQDETIEDDYERQFDADFGAAMGLDE